MSDRGSTSLTSELSYEVNQSGSPRPDRKGKPTGVVFSFVIGLGLLAVVWFSFGQNVLFPHQEAGVAERLGEMRLAKVLQGKEALAEVNALHGIDIGVSDALVAQYSHTFNPYHASNNEKVTVWVGKAADSVAAAGLLRRMVEGIARGGSGFGNPEPMILDRQELFQADGPGGKHFFYVSQRSPDSVVWLTIESNDVEPILELSLKAF